jgi:hypothetical protein
VQVELDLSRLLDVVRGAHALIIRSATQVTAAHATSAQATAAQFTASQAAVQAAATKATTV